MPPKRIDELNPPRSDGRLGEVVEASTTSFTSQCYRLYDAPPLGSLVRGGSDAPVYGIVHEVSTRSMDPSRHPIPRGNEEDTEEGVYLSNPQLNRLLLTEFHSTVVGHKTNGLIHRSLAPLPVRIHSFVYKCEPEDWEIFSNVLDFIPLLLTMPVSVPDEVIASFLKQASEFHTDPNRFLLSAGRQLASHLGGQLQRLNDMLRRLSS